MVHTWHNQGETRGDGGNGVGQVERRSAGGRTRISIGFGSLGLKTVQEAGFLVWASKPRSEGLSEAKRPTDVPRHVAESVWVVWASKPPRRRVSRFSPQNLGRRARWESGEPKVERTARKGCVEWRQGVPSTRGRRMRREKDLDENAPAWVV